MTEQGITEAEMAQTRSWTIDDGYLEELRAGWRRTLTVVETEMTASFAPVTVTGSPSGTTETFKVVGWRWVIGTNEFSVVQLSLDIEPHSDDLLRNALYQERAAAMQLRIDAAKYLKKLSHTQREAGRLKQRVSDLETQLHSLRAKHGALTTKMRNRQLRDEDQRNILPRYRSH